MRAYLYDNSDADKRELHDSGSAVSEEELLAVGVEYRQLRGSVEERLAAVEALCQERGYKNRDEINISPQMDGYEAKLEIFFTEHIHEDEEIRFVMEGAGFFDVRDRADRWVRIFVEEGDLLILPAGIYHRFTLDTTNHLRAMRLFKDEPKWTPINRPVADANRFHIEHLRSIGAAV
ncbi:1,2-dihydroxy-3-keto-5-methylthiopentene dioxygenase [Coemansia javaensis]|uniref:Acireductone dioxygenase n=1 Tax=Coemansia javaensis TaxID=2761396 RepID=A0A9W8H474_9FUNG|nr:1,2-dihydroxy-3-keto-5-methylthiopentene dioxygenase [Coemansia javaensis]